VVESPSPQFKVASQSVQRPLHVIPHPPVRIRAAALLAFAVLALACDDPVSPPGGHGARPILFIGRPKNPDGNIGKPVIYVVRGDGSGLRVLANGLGDVRSAAWSRDGARVAFASGGDLWIVNADGSDPHRASSGFPQCFFDYTSISWAPTGDRLAAQCFEDTSIFDLRSGTSYSLSALTALKILNPDWSPDGTRLAFGGPFIRDVSAVGVDGTGLTRLVEAASDPAWSPDGRQLAFVWREKTRQSIYVANVDGSNRRTVTTPDSVTFDGAPTWSPDGRWLAFQRLSASCAPPSDCIGHFSLYVVRLNGTGLLRLTPDSLEATLPSW